jgi:hypothetical protein
VEVNSGELHRVLGGTAHADALIALALPDFPRYQKLKEETREALQKLGIAVLFVEKTGDVRAFGLP